tara:strand:- start:49 stop:516 length:468 start_codon:yes stop_codon:yes gene_type:complete
MGGVFIMNNQQKKDAVAIKTAIDNVDAKKAASKRTPIPAETGGGGSLNPSLTITLADNYDTQCHGTLPKQVRLAMSIVWNDFNGQCTVADLDKAWTEKYMDEGGNNGAYTQGVIARLGSKSFFTHYFSGSNATVNLTSRKGALTNEQYKKYIAIA